MRVWDEDAGEGAVRPCGCGRPIWPEAAEEEFDVAGEGRDPNRWCPHWCIEDVPHNEVKEGDWFAIQGDVPLEVSWHEATADADPVTGGFPHRSIYSSGIQKVHSTPFDPVQPCRVLRLSMIGRQTIAPEPPAPSVLGDVTPRPDGEAQRFGPGLVPPLTCADVPDGLNEAVAKATYALGDHLHTWDDASPAVHDAYRSAISKAAAEWGVERVLGDWITKEQL